MRHHQQYSFLEFRQEFPDNVPFTEFMTALHQILKIFPRLHVWYAHQSRHRSIVYSSDFQSIEQKKMFSTCCMVSVVCLIRKLRLMMALWMIQNP